MKQIRFVKIAISQNRDHFQIISLDLFHLLLIEMHVNFVSIPVEKKSHRTQHTLKKIEKRKNASIYSQSINHKLCYGILGHIHRR